MGPETRNLVVNALSLPGVGRFVIGRDIIDSLRFPTTLGPAPFGMRPRLQRGSCLNLRFEAIYHRSPSGRSGDILSRKHRNGRP